MKKEKHAWMLNLEMIEMKNNDDIKIARELIKNADAVLITAGAGMGVDSGLPDFRGTKGFWKAYPPIEKLGLSFSDIADPKWFKVEPKLAWAFYGHRLNLYRKTVPHEGFAMLLDLVKLKNENYFVMTSNVDGQFQKAGFDEEKIYEIHGSIHYFQCAYNSYSKTCKGIIWNAKDETVDINMDKFEALNIPICPTCKEIARPNILMFGDWDWLSSRSSKQEAQFNKWIKKNRRSNIVIIEVGAGTAIPSIRLKGEHIAKTYPNAKLIRINPRDSEVNFKNVLSIELGGLDGIEAICKRD